jgi:hypothetical protein
MLSDAKIRRLKPKEKAYKVYERRRHETEFYAP